MKKTNQLNKSRVIQNKALSIALILLLTFLSNNLVPKRLEASGWDFNLVIPIFTIFLSGYVFQYGLKKIISKISFTILILLTLYYLCLFWFISQF